MLDTPPDGLVLERAIPGFDGTAGDGPITTDETGTAFTTGRSNGFFDFATVHAVTTASLGSLGRAYPGGNFDARRLRPNLVIDMLGDGFPEDGRAGRQMHLPQGGVAGPGLARRHRVAAVTPPARPEGGQGSRPVTAWPVATSNGTEAWS